MLLEDQDKLFDNYTNYLYKLADKDLFFGGANKYILFNPSLHYWVCLDEISCEIYQFLKGTGTIQGIKEKLIDKYNISSEIFNEDVLPFINNLVEKKFLTTEKTEAEASWMQADVDNNDITAYPFNDLYISLSDICNLNCIYCFNYQDRKKRLSDNKKPSLTTEKIINLMREFKSLGGKGVVFTGENLLLIQILFYYVQWQRR